MTTEELNLCIEKHPKNQTQIGADIGFSRSKMTRLTQGAKIDESDSKLLRLYFFGDIPFESIRPSRDLRSELKFNGQEWEIIKVLSNRVGMTLGQWIGEQVRRNVKIES